MNNLVNYPEPDSEFFFVEEVIFLDQKLSESKDYKVLDTIFEVKEGSFMFLPWISMRLESKKLNFDFMEVALHFNCEVTYLKSHCIGLGIEHMYRPAILNLVFKS